MHGLGNDFILVDDRPRSLPEDKLPGLAARLCDRHFGVGADGLILVRPSDTADFQMRVINSDGSEAEMCGNGIRCFAVFLHEKGITSKNPVSVETRAGVLSVDLSKDPSGTTLVRVDMGEPGVDRAAIPMAGEGSALNVPLEVDGRTFVVNGVSMGNPHAVVFLDSLEEFDWERYGPQLMRHPAFPKQTNVHFVEKVGPDELRVKVWERGAGPTLACGTGACAVTTAAVLNGLTGRDITVHLPGGPLRIEWDATTNHLFMTGPAVSVFEGETVSA
jgi:diaminopimelate epimerase